MQIQIKPGKRLRELRKQQGMPIDLLAYLAGCSTRTLVAYEKWGIIPRRPETRERIARVLGVDTNWLFEIDDKAEG
jgi:transcriptional regulator with XRE-family HTH domain